MADKTIVVRIVGDSGQFVAQMAAAGASVQTMGNQVAAGSTRASTAVSRFGKIASTVGKVTTLGIAAGLALSAKAAIDFESSFAGIRKTVDASESQFGRLEDQIRNLSTTIPIGVNELNRIGELGGQLGVGVGDLPEFIETIAKLGVTTTLSTEQAALGLARLDNILQLGGGSFDNMASSIVDLGNNFATTEDEILTFALRVAPVGATVGLVADEVLAIAAAFSSVGIPAERGGTAVQKALIAIDEAAMNGGQELEIFARTAGTTVETFRELAQTDPAEAFQAFIVGLQRVNTEGGNVFQLLDDVGLGSARVVNSMLGMANASDVLVDSFDMSEEAFETNIALTEEAEKRFGTTASKIELAKNQLQDMAITMGQEVLPIVGEVADKFADFIFGLGRLEGPAVNLIGILAGIVSGLTVGSIALKGFGRALGITTGFMGQTTVAAAGLRGILGGGLLLAVGWAIGEFTKWSELQRDSKLRVDNMTEALKREAEGMEGITVATIKQQLIAEGHQDTLLRLGIGAETFAKAISGNEKALGMVNTRLKDTKALVDAFGAAEENAGGLFLTDSDINRRNETARDYADVLNLLTGRTDEYALSIDEFNKSQKEVQRGNLLDAIADGIDTFDQDARDAAEAADGFSLSLEKMLVPATVVDEELTAITDAVGLYQESIENAFTDASSHINDQIDLWGEMGDAVEFNVDDIISNVTKQFEIQGQFLDLLDAEGITGKTREFFKSWELEQQAGFLALYETTEGAADAKKLIEFYQSLFAGDGPIASNIEKLYGQEIPAILEQGAATLFDEMNRVAEVYALQPGVTPVESWLGVMQATIESAPDEMRPLLAQAINQMFDSGLFYSEMFGEGENALQGFIDGIYEMFPELARAIWGIRKQVIGGIEGGFDTYSPSKLMMKYGNFVGEGFAMGIDQATTKFFPDMPSTFMRGAVASMTPSTVSNVTNNNQQAPTTVVVNGSRHNDLRSDISGGLIAGNVTRQVSTLVRT